MRYSVKQCAYEVITDWVKESYSSSFLVYERQVEEKEKKPNTAII